MANIQNKQNISISNSSGVTIGNIENGTNNAHINTEGGSYIEGNVQTQGDFAGNTLQKSDSLLKEFHVITQKTIPAMIANFNLNKTHQQAIIESMSVIQNEMMKGENVRPTVILEQIQNIQALAPAILQALSPILLNLLSKTPLATKDALDLFKELRDK